MSAHVISKQCDILIYDAGSFPVIFKDEDFVVLRPESVKSVIEVKGNLSPKEVKSCLEGILDFGRKWRECQLFYKSHHQKIVPRPMMFVMAWDIAMRNKGIPSTNGTKIRKMVCDFYRKNLLPSEYSGMPVLSNLFVYNECEIFHCGFFNEVDNESVLMDGWATTDGRFTRFDKENKPYRGSDKTIASLLAGVHNSLGTEFNRFFSYIEETHIDEDIKYDHKGIEFWLKDEELIRAINTDIPI